MTNIMMQTAPAGDAFDIGLLSAGDSMQTVLVESLSGPIEIFV